MDIQIFFFMGMAIWVISLLAVFTTNLSSVMRSPARSKMAISICLGYMFLFSLLAASLITRIIVLLQG